MNETLATTDPMPPINEHRQVSARDVHAALGVKTEFASWFKRRVEEYGFSEGQDFSPILTKTLGRPQTDYLLSMDMAKELAMLENNETGRKMRRYFIDAEKRLAAAPPALPHQALAAIQQINSGLIEMMQDHTGRLESLETVASRLSAQLDDIAANAAPPGRKSHPDIVLPRHPEDSKLLALLTPEVEYKFSEIAELCRDHKLYPRLVEGADFFGKWRLSDASVARLGLRLRKISRSNPQFLTFSAGRHRRFIYSPASTES